VFDSFGFEEREAWTAEFFARRSMGFGLWGAGSRDFGGLTFL
jgi:hypothetical protein